MPWVNGIVQVGARGLGSARPGDVDDARAWGVHFFPMSAVRRNGLDGVVEALPENARVYIALDIDALDPAVVPGVIGPAPGGFDYGAVMDLFVRVASRCQIVGFNLVEFMPDNDLNGRGALVCARLAATVAGLVSRQKRAP